MALYAQEFGPANAATIVFLHGGGVGGWMWKPQIAQLQDEYHLARAGFAGARSEHRRQTDDVTKCRSPSGGADPHPRPRRTSARGGIVVGRADHDRVVESVAGSWSIAPSPAAH